MDFLIHRDKGFVAIEVKAKPHLGPCDFAGLKAIADLLVAELSA